jgi:hypothetical protein
MSIWTVDIAVAVGFGVGVIVKHILDWEATRERRSEEARTGAAREPHERRR